MDVRRPELFVFWGLPEAVRIPRPDKAPVDNFSCGKVENFCRLFLFPNLQLSELIRKPYMAGLRHGKGKCNQVCGYLCGQKGAEMSFEVIPVSFFSSPLYVRRSALIGVSDDLLH